jgi:hypothetical protein
MKKPRHLPGLLTFVSGFALAALIAADDGRQRRALNPLRTRAGSEAVRRDSVPAGAAEAAAYSYTDKAWREDRR